MLWKLRVNKMVIIGNLSIEVGIMSLCKFRLTKLAKFHHSSKKGCKDFAKKHEINHDIGHFCYKKHIYHYIKCKKLPLGNCLLVVTPPLPLPLDGRGVRMPALRPSP
jgi:hypothetical protein